MTAPEVLNGWNSNWWALGLRALAAILLGVIALALPGPTLAAIVIVFGIYAITDGVLAIIAAIRGIRRKERWGAMLFEGIIGIIAGVVALLWPGIGALALTYLVAGWALATGAFEIAAAIRLRKIMTGEWLLMIAGILSIVLAVLVAAFPGVGALTLVWWLGAYALAYGVISLVLALRVRSWTTANA
ncbi:MAG: hypothetical protein QOH22_1673 [Gemmatimonadaceae bacterium]|jgi:uncharacterized membrane protein HdeD (DUF308 family)|nr:hypothetical protein [Gemmatimonadaceae bacterium]